MLCQARTQKTPRALLLAPRPVPLAAQRTRPPLCLLLFFWRRCCVACAPQCTAKCRPQLSQLRLRQTEAAQQRRALLPLRRLPHQQSLSLLTSVLTGLDFPAQRAMQRSFWRQ